MSTDPPKKRTGGSKKHQDNSEELRIHMDIRAKMARLIEMSNRHDQIRSSERDLMAGILVDLDKQGQKYMTRVEEEAPPPTTPPPPPPETKPSTVQRPSMKPTVMAIEAFGARTFERTIRKLYGEAVTEHDRSEVIKGLRRGIDGSAEYAGDSRLQALEEELRRQ